jgi:hypothetical protein
MFHGLLLAANWEAGMVADDQAVFVVTDTVPPGRYAWVVSTWLDGGQACAVSNPRELQVWQLPRCTSDHGKFCGYLPVPATADGIVPY